MRPVKTDPAPALSAAPYHLSAGAALEDYAMRWLICLVCLSGLALVSRPAPEALAQANEVKFTTLLKGAVEDEGLKKGAPEVITTQKGLEKLWKAWKIGVKVPTVDFTKQLVIVGTAGGSRLNLSGRLDDKGNLDVIGIATSDFVPGFRYVLAVVGREGIKTVNKKALPEE
jgi:hypothetical protein